MRFEWDEDKNAINKENIKFRLKQRHMFLMILIISKCLISSIVLMKIGILR